MQSKHLLIWFNDVSDPFYKAAYWQLITPIYKEMLHILEAKLGPVNQDVATTLNNLALLYESWGEYEKARLLCQRLEKSSNNPGQYKHFHT